MNQLIPETLSNNTEFHNNTGIMFYAFSDKSTPSYFQYSVLTFYISIVLVIGRVLRGILVTTSARIFITDMPQPDSILMLCESIMVYRMQGRLDKEEEMYFILIDILRSPEMIKAITGSSIKKPDKKIKTE